MNTKTSVLAAVLATGLFTMACGGDAPASNATPLGSAPVASGPATSAEPVQAAAATTPAIEAQTRAVAALGPHAQATYPPLPLRGYEPPRPREVVTAAYQFAAEHPEVSSYVPCFCGCEHGGHKGNHDCFVKSRAANGDVVEWEEHGLECAVCIDVATRSRQLLSSGASLPEIRTAIEREFAPNFPSMTPTPKPPAAGHAH